MSGRASGDISSCDICGEPFSSAVEAQTHGRIHEKQAAEEESDLKVDVSMTPAEERENEREDSVRETRD